ncbi:LuxR C-terminal-related transcriptional regulator [Edaphovirga cremea]|uniref:helix-turn-helix transcriptional regulator n=1 Tax=Edaphovirga cremea TaxID=2267246 RepID=UPI003988C666
MGNNIFLQHACMYTRVGIKSLLENMDCDCPVNVITDIEDLNSSRYPRKNTSDTDIFILGMQGNGSNPSKTLSFIVERLPVFSPDAKVIIIAPTFSVGHLRNHLLGLHNVHAVLDRASPLQEFQMQLKEILMLPLNMMRPHKSMAASLSHQELNVLGFLLQGNSTHDVAQKLRIHNKTVSHHKRSALHKLGIRSLHRLIMCDNSRSMLDTLVRKANLESSSDTSVLTT